MRMTTNWTGIFFGFAIAVLAAFHQFKLPPVLPEMTGLYGYDTILAGGFMSIYAVAGFLLAAPFGNRMQRHGTLPFIYLALALFLLGTLVTQLFPENGTVVLTARGIEGIAACILSISGPALATQHASARDQHLAAAITATWVPLGAIMGAGLAFASGTAGFDPKWSPIWSFSLVLTVLLALLTAWYRKSERVEFNLPKPARRAEGDHDPWDVAKNRLLMRLTATVFLFWAWQNLAFMTWMPSYLVSALDLSQDRAALVFLLPITFIGIFNLLAVPLLRTGLSITGLMVLAVTGQLTMLLLMPVVGTGAVGLFCLIVYGACAGITPTCLFNLPGSIFANRGGTRAFGWLITGRNFGVFCGPLSAAAIVDLTGSWQAVPWLVTAIMAVSVLLSVSLHILHRPK
ncbi:MFS transporter [Aestuariispira ectoiniformans]|uniref:MFS transporter n=1 Tax=Aestuariispira ectoiniformans TaxID=2775080 RepID=UPI00223B8B2B|nr:MFS transporter [Aestuariispira ectoiniformans]